MIGSTRRIAPSLLLLAALPLLAQCDKLTRAEAPPPRVEEEFKLDPSPSTIAVPVSADLAPLYAALEREVPRRLWTIDKPNQTCVASKKVKVLVVKIKTPTIKCRLVGEVTRGALSLSGQGRDIVVSMPIHAVVRARDIAGVVKQETATADARVKAIVRLDLAQDWSPRAKVDIVYDWTREPTMEILGQTIRLTDQADAKLKGVVAKLERTLPAELAKLPVRRAVQAAWADSYTTLQLNKTNPPVWMRVTPQELYFGGYSVTGRRLQLNLGMQALAETFVGDRPADPPAQPLPPLKPLTTKPGLLAFDIPVLADYAQLEPVIMEALVKRSARPFDLPGVGQVKTTFTRAQVYATTNRQIAVGVDLMASDEKGLLGQSKGTVWLVGTPVNAENSREITFTDVKLTGGTDNKGTNLLLKLANAPGFAQTIGEALAQNFTKDFAELLGKIDRAIAEKREGSLLIRAEVTDVKTGKLQVTGQGLYLPVRASGRAGVTVTALN